MKFLKLLVALLIITVSACNTDHHTHENRAGHDHLHEEAPEHEHEEIMNPEEEEHESDKIQYTAYTSSYELFAEADIFVVGKEAHILSHFSLLPSFRPLETGSITTVLSIDGKEVRQTLNEPTRTGIYSFEITPVASGTGTLRFYIDSSVVTVSDVRVYATQHEAHEQFTPKEYSMINQVVFTKEQSWKIDFKTEVVKKQPFGQVIKTVAKTVPNSLNETAITAKTGGIVLFSNNQLLEGKEVTTGQSLFTISSGGMSENNIAVKIREAKNNFEKARADYNRTSELAKEKIISEKDLLNAKTTYENSKAVYENLTNNFHADGQNINSPANGFIKQVAVANGQFVEAGQLLMTISQSHTVVLKAFVQEQYSNILPTIVSANINVLQNSHTYTLEELNGKIVSYGKAATDDGFLIPVNIQIDNIPGLIQGTLVEIYLKTLTNPEALVVPNTSLLEDQGNYFVFVQQTPEMFEKRLVKTGFTDGIHTEIISGMVSGERIVSKGAMLIKLAQASSALDPHSGHVH